MTTKDKPFVHQVNVKWIKAKSGTTYLCPVKAVEKLKNPTEEQLRMICVDESMNPQS